MAKTAADARAMVEAAKKSGKKLTIGYQHRHKPEARYLKSVIERGDLGDIYYAHAYAIRRRGTPNWGVFLNEYEQGGGPLIDIGTHSLDLTLYLMNNYRPRMVVGTTYKKVENPEMGNPWGGWPEGANTMEDAAFGFIVMENGATINLEATWALNTIEPIPEGSTQLCGSKAGAQIKGGVSINKAEFGRLIEIRPDMSAGGVAFYGRREGNAGHHRADALARRDRERHRPRRPARAGLRGQRNPRGDLQIRQDGSACILRPLTENRRGCSKWAAFITPRRGLSEDERNNEIDETEK